MWIASLSIKSGLSLRSMLTKVKDTLAQVQGGVSSPMQLWRDLHWGDTEEARDKNERAPGCLSEGDTGEVSPCRTCVGEPPSNQMGGDNSDRPSQDLQRTDAQGGNPHQAEPPLPQQGWWAGAAWMLDGRLEEGNPATSGDTP